MNRSVQYLLDLTLVLTRKEMQVRYKNNVLGYLWSLLQPMSFALVYFIASVSYTHLTLPTILLE